MTELLWAFNLSFKGFFLLLFLLYVRRLNGKYGNFSTWNMLTVEFLVDCSVWLLKSWTKKRKALVYFFLLLGLHIIIFVLRRQLSGYVKRKWTSEGWGGGKGGRWGKRDYWNRLIGLSVVNQSHPFFILLNQWYMMSKDFRRTEDISVPHTMIKQEILIYNTEHIAFNILKTIFWIWSDRTYQFFFLKCQKMY